ncbi:thioesterase II family protein [Streptomyces sp. NPDC048142]|uniref:thioesterase II family protein n=1 Tax=Streptomyces sp. NPDC048142 TaxID=3365501 RepID=UPI003720FB5D
MGSEWLRGFGSPGGNARHAERPTLLCFPHAGGAASTYTSLSRALASEVEVLAVQYPGRQDRRRQGPLTSIDALADALTEVVRSELHGPFAFFGHSMGAVIAYETARRLSERRASTPVRMFLSARGAPGVVPNPRDRIATDAELLAAVRRLGGTATALLDDPEVREMVMPALRADYRALATYVWRPGEPLAMPFTVMAGDSDPVVTVAEASAWRDFTTADTTIDVFPGGHFYLDGQLLDVARAVVDGLVDVIPSSATLAS